MANNRFSFIINPKFQFNFSLFICGLVFVGSLIYLITIWDIFETFISMNFGNNNSALEANRNELMGILLLIQVAYLGLVFAFSLIISHRIAGPMYKLSIYLQDLREGQSRYPLTFREKDEFQEIAEEINDTIEYLTHKREDEIDYLNEIAAYIENISLVVPEDKKPVLQAIQAKIQEITSEHN